MDTSPLQQALARLSITDDMGGFKTVAAILFPGWEPKCSCRAPHREDRQASFSIYRNESGEWRFKDFGNGDEQGGLVGFVMLTGMDKSAASRWLMEKARIPTGQQAFQPAPRPQPKVIANPAEKLPPMPVEAIAKWSEGVDYLEANTKAVEWLADLRGWPLAWAQYLVDCAAISMPLYHSQRALAFLVETPEGNAGGMMMRDLGFHCRLEPRPGEKRASWRFFPNDKEHGQSTPALPFVLGGSSFDSAKLLVITGGQWDALTFAFAAGWLGDGRHWPEGVCVIGLRGDSSTNAFLQTYGRFWSNNPSCLLMPDSDASGEKWAAGNQSFASQLAARCWKVAVVKCGTEKDFNDLYRAVQITPEQIAELLASHGMGLENGVLA